MTLEAWYRCAACGERNDTTVDPTAGRHQSYVEDCQVCCRPNILTISLQAEGGRLVAVIDADTES